MRMSFTMSIFIFMWMLVTIRVWVSMFMFMSMLMTMVMMMFISRFAFMLVRYVLIYDHVVWSCFAFSNLSIFVLLGLILVVNPVWMVVILYCSLMIVVTIVAVPMLMGYSAYFKESFENDKENDWADEYSSHCLWIRSFNCVSLWQNMDHRIS